MGPGGWFQDWSSAEDLNLQVFLAAKWSHYMSLLKHNSIVLQDQEDDLKWSKSKASGTLTAKLGYEFELDHGSRLYW